MRLTKNTPKLPKKLPPPELNWQTDDFAKVQEFRFYLPYSFLLLCKLWDTTPREIINDFMENLSHGSYNRHISELAKPHLQQYILEMGYGQQRYYDVKDIKTMFRELDAIGLLWPKNAKTKMMDMHARWRDKYYSWWFKKWYRKQRRKSTTDEGL